MADFPKNPINISCFSDDFSPFQTAKLLQDTDSQCQYRRLQKQKQNAVNQHPSEAVSQKIDDFSRQRQGRKDRRQYPSEWNLFHAGLVDMSTHRVLFPAHAPHGKAQADRCHHANAIGQDQIGALPHPRRRNTAGKKGQCNGKSRHKPQPALQGQPPFIIYRPFIPGALIFVLTGFIYFIIIQICSAPSSPFLFCHLIRAPSGQRLQAKSEQLHTHGSGMLLQMDCQAPLPLTAP